MPRSLAILLTLSFTVAAAIAQDSPIRRAGQALDRAGKSIRYRLETEVARGQEVVYDREVMHRVARRIEWDKQVLGSVMRVEVQPGGRVVVQGSVPSEAVKARVVDVVSSTIGVTSVVDELAVKNDAKLAPAKPAPGRVIESKPIGTPKTEVDIEP